MDTWINHYLKQCGAPLDSTHHLLVQAIAPKLSNSKLSVQQLAGMFDVSRRQLYRDIHTLLDKPVAQWVRELRLYKAQWLAQQKKTKDIDELATSVGFRNAPYFRRIYLDFFGTDPAIHFPHSTTYLAHKLNDR